MSSFAASDSVSAFGGGRSNDSTVYRDDQAELARVRELEAGLERRS